VTAVSEVEELPELSFVRPLPGFGDLRRFVLVELPVGDGALFELRSLEEPAVRFVAAVPTAFFPDYAFDLDEGDCDQLGLADETDALVLVLLTMGGEAAATTANLLAPVVVNARTRQAAQVILSGSDWPVRAAVA
jgi:flagellar assembly factor FliW